MRTHPKTKPVGVLTKALRVVDILQDSRSPLSLHEISIQAGINKSTALRLLAHLECEKYLRRDERGGYSLGPKFLRLGSEYNVQTPLRDTAREALWELWRITQETVNLAVLDGLDVVYIDCLESPDDLRLVSNVGMRAVLYRTALGKALLAFQPAEQCERLIKSRFETFTPHTVTSAFELDRELNPIRQSGFAVDNEEKASWTPLHCRSRSGHARSCRGGDQCLGPHQQDHAAKDSDAGGSGEGCRSRGVGSDGKSARHGITTLPPGGDAERDKLGREPYGKAGTHEECPSKCLAASERNQGVALKPPHVSGRWLATKICRSFSSYGIKASHRTPGESCQRGSGGRRQCAGTWLPKSGDST